MDPGHQLKALLQVQLASDASAVINLAYAIQTLDETCFIPSSHLAKWTSRIGSLLHSKDAGGRWAGLCLAHRSSLLSRQIMIESAASWIPIALPILSRNEGIPTLKAAIRLLLTIFTSAIDMPEFQRQISTPNVPKFTNFLATIAASSSDIQLRSYCLKTLSQIIPVYPNAHKASFSPLTSLSLGFLNGSHPCPTDARILQSASKVYSVLHLTGGKVGAAAVWRKSMDETLAFGWNTYFALRTTFPTPGLNAPPPTQGDPSVVVPLNLDRLRCCSVIVRAMLETITTRPVQISLGQLVKFGVTLISSSIDEKMERFCDPVTRTYEVAAVKQIWKEGCNILVSLAQALPQHLNPYLSRIATVLIYHIEQPSTAPVEKAHFLETLQVTLNACHLIDAPVLPNRVVKAVLPLLTVILNPTSAKKDGPEQGGSKNSRKRARNYEGDEVFKTTRDVLCPSFVEGKVLLNALEVVRLCLENPSLAAPQLSLASRILLAIQLALSQMSPNNFSANTSLFDQVYRKVQSICAKLASSSTVALHKATPLIVSSLLQTGQNEVLPTLDLLLHPRLPPVVRPIPSVAAISLFKTEESQEETDARQMLGLGVTDTAPNQLSTSQLDVDMAEPVHVTTTEPSDNPPPKPSDAVDQQSIARIATEPPRTSLTGTSPLVPQISQKAQPMGDDEASFVPLPNKTVAPAAPRPTAQPQKAKEPTVHPIVPIMPLGEDDEDQEMPTIDLASDSGEEED